MKVQIYLKNKIRKYIFVINALKIDLLDQIKLNLIMRSTKYNSTISFIYKNCFQ